MSLQRRLVIYVMQDWIETMFLPLFIGESREVMVSMPTKWIYSILANETVFSPTIALDPLVHNLV